MPERSAGTLTDKQTDARWMARALELAGQGIGLASPNPAVGCVVLDGNGEWAGEGWHEYDRRDHAEVVALRQAGDRARGGTAYVTLEPCNHTGRTGPCSEALIAAGIGRVVAATADPNPLVAGEGLARLRQAGVAVALGAGQVDAQRINEGFAHWIRQRRPLVEMKVAMTLDGRIAPAPQHRRDREIYRITGPAALAAVQQMRWAADAILTGVDTVIADDPLLTDRSGRARRRPLLRVVLDSSLRTPLDARLVASAAHDVTIFTVSQDAARRQALEARGVRVVVLPDEPEECSGRLPEELRRVPLSAVLDVLGQENILRLLTETGSRLNTALIARGLVDRLTAFVAPQLLGSDAIPAFAGLSAPIGLTGPNSSGPNSSGPEWTRYGQDFALSTLLHDPWVPEL